VVLTSKEIKLENTIKVIGIMVIALAMLIVGVVFINKDNSFKELENVNIGLELENKDYEITNEYLLHKNTILQEKSSALDDATLYIAELEQVISMYAELPAYNMLLKNDPVDTIPELDQKLLLFQKVYDYFPIGNPLRQRFRITAHYGDDVLNHQLRVHKGVDLIPADPHTNTIDIYPSNPGIVTEIGISRIYGKYILLEHPGGYQTFYAHLDKIFYSADWGKEVTIDTKMGIMGNTGQSTGPHLHYEIRYFNEGTGLFEKINPEPFLKERLNGED